MLLLLWRRWGGNLPSILSTRHEMKRRRWSERRACQRKRGNAIFASAAQRDSRAKNTSGRRGEGMRFSPHFTHARAPPLPLLLPPGVGWCDQLDAIGHIWIHNSIRTPHSHLIITYSAIKREALIDREKPALHEVVDPSHKSKIYTRYTFNMCLKNL